MNILDTKSLECNRKIKINFNGDDLSLLFRPTPVMISNNAEFKNIFINKKASDSKKMWINIYQIKSLVFYF